MTHIDDQLPLPTASGRAAVRLFEFLEHTYWSGSVLEGPDPGIRFNTRVGRFIKSYLRWAPWRDHLVYQQAQGYWTLDNWSMWRTTGDSRHRAIAIATSDSVLAAQTPEGFWPYPNPEWRGRVATVEGSFAALGLLETYGETRDDRYLDAAVRWQRFMEERIGYRRQSDPSMTAINYFLHQTDHGGGVPNNSTLVLWLLARLWETTGESRFLDRAPALVAWLGHAQLDTGELPYKTAGEAGPATVHFLCHQYNAFEFMDLVHYRRITGDERVTPILERLAGFLASGVTDELHAAYDCDDRRTNVLYYDLALAQALKQATDLGLGSHDATVSAIYRQVIEFQRTDGSFAYHSARNYGFLRDVRSYPRYLSMMLRHLLLGDAQGVVA